MVTSRGGEAQARRWVRWDVPRGGGVAPWRRRPRWGRGWGGGAGCSSGALVCPAHTNTTPTSLARVTPRDKKRVQNVQLHHHLYTDMSAMASTALGGRRGRAGLWGGASVLGRHAPPRPASPPPRPVLAPACAGLPGARGSRGTRTANQ